jgi:dienelactone hydrolase
MSIDSGRVQAGDSARVVQIPTGTVALEGELIVPPNPVGLILYAHDLGSHRPPHERPGTAHRLFVPELLRKAGLGTMQFNLVTRGEDSDPATRNHLIYNMGLLTQRLVCAAHWVAEEDEARHLPIGLLGTGTGSGAALVTAADLPRSISAVVSLTGRPDLAGNALRRVKIPTLLVVAERDEENLALNEEAFEMLAAPKALSVVRGASQDLHETGSAEAAAQLVSSWFLQHLRRMPASRFGR